MSYKFIKIFHPEIPGSEGEVTEKAYAEVWEPKGWRKTDSESPQPSTVLEESSDEYTIYNDPEED